MDLVCRCGKVRPLNRDQAFNGLLENFVIFALVSKIGPEMSLKCDAVLIKACK